VLGSAAVLVFAENGPACLKGVVARWMAGKTSCFVAAKKIFNAFERAEVRISGENAISR
jgi:hypothetical protein